MCVSLDSPNESVSEVEVSSSVEVKQPTEWGFYKYSGGNQLMVFMLHDGQWWAWFQGNPTPEKCVWAYIEQALSVYDLVKI